ncbi:MAG: bacteriohemerythrin [Magnetospirillum sp.]|nr:bacteriohemerythrin [Magnetospirillum sp.]
MATISWSALMSAGIPEIDADHKTLIGLVNALHRSIGDEEEYATLGSVLKALQEYTEYHFAREERVMGAARYPSLIAHSLAHRRHEQQVRDLRQRYEDDRQAVRAKECLDFLHKWLIEHICSTDMDYRPWVIGHAGAVSAAESISITGPRPVAATLDWRALRLLVVDDNRNFSEVMRTILEGVGVRDIAVAHDLSTAKLAVEGKDFDIVIIDWHVGAESGLDLVAWLRRHPLLKDLPILMLSGHERIGSREMVLAAGADEFMEKPISARGLLLCLARLLTRREQSR